MVLAHPYEGRQIGTIIPETGDTWVLDSGRQFGDYLTREEGYT